ncbi:MAG: cytochrome c [Bacteroidetes bacterium]|nr:cytochrome c [Bacteroidota bacterium]MDA1268686.1 cytochrome c [Bacteroidota bacterium]
MRFLSTLIFLGLLTSSCSPKASNLENNLAQISDAKVLQFAIPGKELYENYCANCHQKDGRGLGKLIPPLRDADYFKADIHRSIWIMKYGQEGEILVNGQVYNQAMPANPNLRPLDLAQIATYLYNSWGMKEGVIDAPLVESYLKSPPAEN